MSRTTWQVHKFHMEIIPKHNYVPKGNLERPVKKFIAKAKGNSNKGNIGR